MKLIDRTINVLSDYVTHKTVEMHVMAELLDDWKCKKEELSFKEKEDKD